VHEQSPRHLSFPEERWDDVRAHCAKQSPACVGVSLVGRGLLTLHPAPCGDLRRVLRGYDVAKTARNDTSKLEIASGPRKSIGAMTY
jgi:hypothetical protein